MNKNPLRHLTSKQKQDAQTVREATTSTPPVYDARDKLWADHEVPLQTGVTFRQVWNETCPHCKSGPGWMCVGPTGFHARTHKKRIKLAQDKLNEQHKDIK